MEPIHSIEDIKFVDIPFRILTHRKYDDAALFHEYDNYEPLEEVYKLSKMIVPKPKETEKHDWYIVNIFGYEYTHGYLFDMPECGEDYSGLSYEEELINHYFVRRHRQNDYLAPIKKRYLDGETIVQLLAFNIDPAKFWYALLWLMQYVNEKADCECIKYRSASECIDEFIDSVNKEWENHHDILPFRNRKKPIYKIQLETHERKGTKTVKIDNPLVTNLIASLLSEKINEIKEDLHISDKQHLTDHDRFLLDNEIKKHYSYIGFINEDKVVRRKHERLYLFRKCLTPYLDKQPKEKFKDFISHCPDELKKYTDKLHINKDELIARLLWVVGFISDDEKDKWLNDKDKLRVYLKDYEGRGIETKESVTYEDNSIY